MLCIFFFLVSSMGSLTLYFSLFRTTFISESGGKTFSVTTQKFFPLDGGINPWGDNGWFFVNL